MPKGTVFNPRADGFEVFPNARDVFLHPDDPTKLVRMLEHHEGPDAEAVMSYATEIKNLHTELADDYDIAVVGYEIDGVIDDDYYGAVVDKLTGISFYEDNLSKMSESQSVAAKLLLDKLAIYAEAKIVSGEPFLSDIYDFSDYVFTPADNPVMVDIEPYRGSPRGEAPTGNFSSNALQVHQLIEMGFNFTKLHPKYDAGWQRKGKDLLRLASETNGFSVRNTTLKTCIGYLRGARKYGGDYDHDYSADSFYSIVSELPENDALMERQAEYHRQKR